MILKINLYLETDLKLSPTEVAGAASLIQKTLTQELLEYQDGEPLRFRITAEGRKTEFKLLTKEEVEDRVLGTREKRRNPGQFIGTLQTPPTEGPIQVSRIDGLVKK